MKIKYLLFLIYTIAAYSVSAQNVRDTSINISMVSFHYSFHNPGGDMADRFGVSSTVGGDFVFKTQNGFLFGLDYSFIFGEKVLNKESYFHGIQNSKGYVIDGNGMLAETYIYERGFNAAVILGKQFNIWNLNPNSGPFVQLHAGYIQHYARIENPYKTAPQINGEYAKLYDRLTTGFSMTEFVGYRFMGNHRLWNFYAGFEFVQGFTQGRRSYNVDAMSAQNPRRIDLLSGVRIGWVVPLYGKTKQEFYYY